MGKIGGLGGYWMQRQEYCPINFPVGTSKETVDMLTKINKLSDSTLQTYFTTIKVTKDQIYAVLESTVNANAPSIIKARVLVNSDGNDKIELCNTYTVALVTLLSLQQNQIKDCVPTILDFETASQSITYLLEADINMSNSSGTPPAPTNDFVFPPWVIFLIVLGGVFMLLLVYLIVRAMLQYQGNYSKYATVRL